MIPSTAHRVHRNTHDRLNEEVDRRIRESLEQHVEAHPEIVERRLAELDREWDTDRAMEATYSAAFLTGVGLSCLNSRWRVLSIAAAASLLSHALFGWDPLLPLYRRWRFRTSTEIDYERYALKTVRGDFRHLTHFASQDDLDAIARLEGEGGPAYDTSNGSSAAAPHEALAAVQK
jgi:hypothetical protein